MTGTHFAIELDVTNAENIKNVIEEAINKYKRPPSALVNCAGITRDSFILKMDENDFDLVLNVNLKVNTKMITGNRKTLTNKNPLGYFSRHETCCATND